MLNKLKRAALGAHTPHDKATAASKPVPMPLPAQVRILMSQHIGAPAKAVVKKGDKVCVGTLIGEAAGVVSANIHSSVSGTVTAVEPFRLANGKACDAVGHPDRRPADGGPCRPAAQSHRQGQFPGGGPRQRSGGTWEAQASPPMSNCSPSARWTRC